MDDYYSEKLSANRLRLCYELAPDAVKQYLGAEIEYVAQKITSTSRVLELGCGYGRVLKEISRYPAVTMGIDTSFESLVLACEYLKYCDPCFLFQMNAVDMGLHARQFDLVFCIQNGISAFHVDQAALISEAVRVTRPGGRVLFSSYSEKFWDSRLEWFRIQATHGLVGEIDEDATGDGIIVCRDGFKATTVNPEDFADLATALGLSVSICEVAESSVFLEILVPDPKDRT